MKNIDAIVWVAAFAACGCSARGSSEPSSAVPANRVVITGVDRTYTSAIPAELKATFGAIPTFQLVVEGVSAQESWSLATWLTPEQVAQGTASARVNDRGIGEGVANITRRLTDGTSTNQFNGNMTASVAAGGRVTGTVTTQPVGASATFVGSVVVSCWVPRSVAGVASPGGGTVGPIGDSEPLVNDEALASPQCAPLKTWLAK